MNKETLTLSPLSHTWILDFDGTLVIHNGYKTGEDHFFLEHWNSYIQFQRTM